MRSSKTEYTMGAAGVVSVVDRQFRHALAIVQTQLESNCAIGRACRKRKSAERNQKALCGDGIRDSDADQRAQQAPGCCVPPEHTASHTATLSPVPPGTKAAFVQLSADRDIWATAPKSQEVYAQRGSGADTKTYLEEMLAEPTEALTGTSVCQKPDPSRCLLWVVISDLRPVAAPRALTSWHRMTRESEPRLRQRSRAHDIHAFLREA